MRRSLLILIVLSACHGKRAGKDYFGTQVSPPGVLAQIRPGMTLAEVKTIAPDAKNDPGKGLLLATPKSNVKLYAIMDGDLVQYTYADYAGEDGMAVLTAAWGPPDKEPDRGDLHNTVWRSTATGWRASVFCGNGTDKVKLPPFCTIEFHPHLPIEMMFTKGAVTPPGDLAKVTPRMTLAQLKATTHLSQLTDASTQTTLRWLDYDGAVEHVGVVDGRLYALDYSVPEAARAAIEKAWGPATKEGDHAIWFDAKTGWSAMLEKSASQPENLSLEFVGYQPFAAQLDLLESIAAAPTLDDVKRAHPELEWEVAKSGDSTDPTLYLSCTELSAPMCRTGRFEIVALFGGTSPSAIVGHLDVEREDQILDLLTKRWGAPAKEARERSTSYHFPKHGVLTQLASSLTLDVGAGL